MKPAEMLQKAEYLEQNLLHVPGGNIKISHMQFFSNNNIEGKHKHNDHEIYFCLDGTMRIEAGNTETLLTQNQFVIIPPNLFHRVCCNSGSRYSYFLMMFRCQRNIQAEEDSLLAGIAGILDGDNTILSGTDNYNARRVIDSIQRETKERLAGYEGLLDGYYREFLTLIFRNYLTYRESLKEEDSNVNLAVQITDYITEHLIEDLTLQKVAEAVHITPRHANRVFMEFFGVSLMYGVQSFRVVAAQRWMEEAEDPLERIAERVGFSSARQMNQAFLEREGVTAGEYRLRMKKAASEDKKDNAIHKE